MALSQGLLNRCYDILLKCNEFDDYARLRAIFITEDLQMYQNRLPQDFNRTSLVHQTINYLLPKHLSDGRAVFPIFLATLTELYQPGDELHDELRELYNEMDQTLSRVETINIPFVIVAMTYDEASKLIEETVFDDLLVAPIARVRFHKFRAVLQEYEFEDLLPHYGEDRENWQPHTFKPQTIQEIIAEIVDLINQQRSEAKDSSILVPQFFSSDFFSDDENTRLETWDQLSRRGCVIIVDPISIFHPKLLHLLLASEMGSNEQAAMLILSPIDSNSLPVNQLIEQEIGSQMQRAFARFSEYLDRLCEFGIGDLRSLQRWLFAILPETVSIVQTQRPNPSNRRIFRTKMGEPSGKKDLIFGQRQRGGK